MICNCDVITQCIRQPRDGFAYCSVCLLDCNVDREHEKDSSKDSSNPPYYKFKTENAAFELIDILDALFSDEPLLWQVQKYIARWKHKDTPLENLKKAAWYLNRKIALLEKAKND